VQLDTNKRPTPPKYSQCISQRLILNRKGSGCIIHAEQPRIRDKALLYISPIIQEYEMSLFIGSDYLHQRNSCGSKLKTMFHWVEDKVFTVF
jgi:hypothetical protein